MKLFFAILSVVLSFIASAWCLYHAKISPLENGSYVIGLFVSFFLFIGSGWYCASLPLAGKRKDFPWYY